MNYQRIQVKLALEVSVAADVFFEQLMKWNSIIGWKDPPVALSKVELAKGHQLGRVPCTRLCYVDFAKLPPGISRELVPKVLSETLLAYDPVARTCLYVLDGEGPNGMRNYYATTEVDEVGPNVARVTSTGRCDLPEGASVEVIQAILTATYRRGVIGGTAGMLNGRVL